MGDRDTATAPTTTTTDAGVPVVGSPGDTCAAAVPSPWRDSVSHVLISSSSIASRVTELGASLSSVYASLNPLLLVVLKGSFLFAADLSRALPFPHEVDFIRASSYVATASTGTVSLTGDDTVPVHGRHVLVVEDIVDTGLTLQRLYEALRSRGALSVKCVTLLRKRTARRKQGTPAPDYVAFEIPDLFVIGYGLDIDQRLRHLPFVGIYRQGADE